MAGVTQHQIAEALNISRSTVAAVFSNAPGVRISAEVKARVLETAEKMGYRPNRYAQMMRRRRSGVIGVIHFGGLAQMPTQKLMHTVQAITEARYEPVVHDVFWFANRGGAACEKMVDLRVEGVLLLHPHLFFTQKHLDILLRAGIPVVAMGGDHLKGIPRILSDKEDGFYALTRHLLSLGKRRLILLVGQGANNPRTPGWHTKKAREGFRRALREQDVATGDVHTVFHPLGTPNEEAGMAVYEPARRGMHEILQRPVTPDAVLCSNDSWALGALSVCAEADLSVPRDIAITGAENEPVGEVGLLPLTTVAHPVREIARRATQRLFSMVRGETVLTGELEVIPGELIVRRSCGAHLQSKIQPKTARRHRSASDLSLL